MPPVATSPIALALLSANALAFIFCVGLLITHFCWKIMRPGERLAIAPFFSIAAIIISIKILQQYFGVWLTKLPRPWILFGMNIITVFSIVILIRAYWLHKK